MSLRNHPGRNNSKGADERKEANQEKLCKVHNCGHHRKNYTSYCSQHDNNRTHYGSPHQLPIRLNGDLSPYYRATLKYIEEHEDTLSEYLAIAEKLIRCPEMIRFHSVSEVERWMNPNDYRDKGYPITDQVLYILRRWKGDIKSPKHYLASIIAPHVYTYQEPKRLLGGKPVHMLITRSLINQCSVIHEWEEVTQLRFKKVSKPHYVSPRNKANLGLRLSSMFTSVIAQVYKEIPQVIDEADLEKRKRLEHYKMFEDMYKQGDKRVTEVMLRGLKVKLGI